MRVLPPITALARVLLRMGLVLIVALSCAAYLSDQFYLLDYVAQLRLPFLTLACGGLVLTLIVRWWRWSALAFLGIGLNFWPVATFYLPAQPTVSPSATFKILQFNVYYKNPQPQELIALIREERPDMVTLQEVDDVWAEGLSSLTKQFRESLVRPANHGKGIAIYSQFKFAQAEAIDFGGDHRQNLVVRFDWQGTPISLVATHAPNPFDQNGFTWRTDLLRQAANYMKTLPTPKILVGDLNLTMWSPVYSQLIEQAQLVNTREGHGVLPTWHASLWLPALMIPIDHCLVSPDLNVVQIKTGPQLSSDHLPLIIELSLLKK